MELSREYTAADHETRNTDSYAISKYRITLRWLRDALSEGGLLLNVGCGGGFFHTMIADRPIQVIGFEPDPEAFELAQKTNPNPAKIRVIPSGLFEISTHLSEPAQAIVMHDVLEHIEDEAAAVAALRSLCTPETKVILSVPALGFLFGQHDVRLGHYRRYSRRTLTHALSPHFDIKRMRYFGFSFIPAVFWFSVIRKQSHTGGTVAGSWIGRLFDLLCRAEELLSFPLGTSLICELRAKPNR